MYLILLAMSCVGIIVTITGLCLNSEMITGMGIILISPAYIYIILCIFGVIKFPDKPNDN